MSKIKIVCSIALYKDNIKKAIKIAIIVGTILNLINQGELIINFDLQAISYPKLLLTYIVPFCVSLYTAITIGMKFKIGQEAKAPVELECHSCYKSEISLKEGQIIPECPNCGLKTKWRLKN